MTILNEYGYSLDQIKFVYTDETGQGDKQIQGFVTTQNDNIYLNLKKIDNMENMLATLGQEIAGLTQKNENIDITTNREEHNKYQDMVSKDLVKDVEFALSLNDNQIDSNTLQTNVNSIEEYLDIQKANSEFALLDKEAGDNLTIFVHGTFASPQSADKDFLEAVSKTYNEAVYQFDWSGKDGDAGGLGAENTTYARLNAASRLTEFVENHQFQDGEKLNIVMHSHGGNVGKDFTQLYEGDKKIDNMTFMGTPVRDDYVIDYSKFVENANIINVYDTSDMVQRGGGSDFQFNFGVNIDKIDIADRIITDFKVKNIEVESGSHPIDSHSDLDSKKVWEQFND